MWPWTISAPDVFVEPPSSFSRLCTLARATLPPALFSIIPLLAAISAEICIITLKIRILQSEKYTVDVHLREN